jgi:hypothetical protein
MESRKYHKIRLSRAGNDTWKFLKEQKALEIPIISVATIVNCIVANKYYDILVALLYEFVALFIMCVFLFLWKSMRSVPERIYEEQQETINSKQKTIESLEERQKPKLIIEFDENDPRYFYEEKSENTVFGKYNSKKYRISVYNTSSTTTIKNVKVRITEIEKCSERLTNTIDIDKCLEKLRGNLPINLQHDHAINIPSHTNEFFDVVWHYMYTKRGEPVYKYYFYKPMISAARDALSLPISANYKIKIEVVGEDTPCKSKNFMVGGKVINEGKDDEKFEKCMWPV